jgi:hypothetical protein
MLYHYYNIMTTTKEELVNTIKEWVTVEKEMKLLSKELKQRRQRKKELANALCETMKQNEIDCFDISDGKIIYTQNKVKAPISKKHLLACLTKYFQEKPNDNSAEIAEYILESRTIKIKDNIRLKGNK